VEVHSSDWLGRRSVFTAPSVKDDYKTILEALLIVGEAITSSIK